MLNEEEQRHLLALARQSLEARVTRGRSPEVVCTGPFALRRGAFVSIHSGDECSNYTCSVGGHRFFG